MCCVTIFDMKTTAIRKTKPAFRGFSGTNLKLIAMLCMFIDHIGASLIVNLPSWYDPESFTYTFYWVLRIIGRISFPIYCFLMIEAIIHTSNRYKYLLRLFIFVILSEIPYDLAFSNTLLEFEDQNVFFTLFFAAFALVGYMYMQEKGYKQIPSMLLKILYLLLPALYFSYWFKDYIISETKLNMNEYALYIAIWVVTEFLLYYFMQYFAKLRGDNYALMLCGNIIILAAMMGLADLLKTDYSSTGVIAVTVMYIYRNNYTRRMTTGCFIISALSNPLELVSFCNVPLVSLYNGKRGAGNKYLFYTYYPAHLLLLFGLNKLFGFY